MSDTEAAARNIYLETHYYPGNFFDANYKWTPELDYAVTTSARPAMKAGDTLRKAAELIEGDRAQTHGHYSVTFEHIAREWTSWLKRRGQDVTITPKDAAMMMARLKQVRMAINPNHGDSPIDGAAYVAIAGDLP